MRRHPSAVDLAALLAKLSDAEVEFIIDLPTLIEVKTKAGRPKDKLVLPILIATQQERDKAKR
jgi:hypothetical protein